MSFFPPPQSPAPPIRCYEDGSCDPPPPSPDSYVTPSNPTPPGPEYGATAEDKDALLAAMQYGLDQRKPQMRGLFGGG